MDSTAFVVAGVMLAWPCVLQLAGDHVLSVGCDVAVRSHSDSKQAATSRGIVSLSINPVKKIVLHYFYLFVFY